VNYGSLPYASVPQTATWQDDQKDYRNSRAFYYWHFADYVFPDEGYVKTLPPVYNVTQFLLDSYSTIMNETTTDKWTLAFQLRSFIHFMGDIHTPFHNINRYTNEFPTGDNGGNSFHISCPFGSCCNNIHFIWDSAGCQFILNDPLNSIYNKDFKKNISRILKENPLSSFQSDYISTFDPPSWSYESFLIARDIGYNITQNSWPSEEYFKTVHEYADKRIVLAAYRLSSALDQFMKNKNIPKYSSTSILGIAFWAIDSVLLILIIWIFIYQHFYKK